MIRSHQTFNAQCLCKQLFSFLFFNVRWNVQLIIHYSDVISEPSCLQSPTPRFFGQEFVQTKTENIKKDTLKLHLRGNYTGDRGIPRSLPQRDNDAESVSNPNSLCLYFDYLPEHLVDLKH